MRDGGTGEELGFKGSEHKVCIMFALDQYHFYEKA